MRARSDVAVSHEGTIPFLGYETWFRIYGSTEREPRLPLVCLHGGPGGSHDYLQPLRDLALDGRRVIFYDQLGGGRSHIDDARPDLWTVEQHIEELQVVLSTLGLDRFHLYGSSWGGRLAMAYMLTGPVGVASLTVASSSASTPQWVAEANRLRAALPQDVQETLVQHEQAGTTDHPEYKAAAAVFKSRHVCRLDPIPDYVQRSYDYTAAYPEVYETMNGPSEFHCIGSLKDWDFRHRLHEIQVPTLITSGAFDEATPAVVEAVHRGIPGSEWVLFEQSSHMPHAEERDLYLQVMTEFLDRIERGGTSDGTSKVAASAG